MGFFKFNTLQHRKVIGSVERLGRRQQAQASFGGSTGSGGYGGGHSLFGGGGGGILSGGGGSNYDLNRFNPVYDRLEEASIVDDWIPKDASGLNKMFRMIYLRDSIVGSAVDFYKNLPFSEFKLIGVEDKSVMKVYQECIDSMNILDNIQDLASEILVVGKVCTSMVFDQTKGFWTDFITHDPDFLSLTPIPIKGVDPKIDLIPSPGMRRFINSPDPRDAEARKKLPDSFLKAFSLGRVPLDPLNTLYLPRRASPYDQIGTSFLTRIIIFWALEKALINATVANARRRSRAILHVKAGIDQTWEPTPDELSSIASLFIQADEDPVGAVVVTRTGVDASEVREGSNFWKLSDEWQFLTEGKMRGMGISEAFLSGDACLIGDTLIPTNKGLIRIGEMGEHGNDPQWRDISYSVASRYKPEDAVKWLYNGYKDTLVLTTERGNKVQCTPNHPVLLFNEATGETVWKRSDQIQTKDLLCVSTSPCVRKEPLKLELSDPAPQKAHGGQCKEVTKPTAMTPDLAFLLGVIVSEGTVYHNQVRIPNTSVALLERCETVVKSVFGIECQTYTNFDPEISVGRKFGSKRKSFELVFSSKTVVAWLDELGAIPPEGESSASYRKELPWSVLQADESCWHAYLAGHIEGDGSLGERLQIISYSQKALDQLLAMLNALGFAPKRYKTRIEMGSVETQLLAERISGFLVDKKPTLVANKARNRFGIPLDYWKRVIQERKIKDTRYGSYFRNDEGREILVEGWDNVISSELRFLYDRHDRGCYTKFLSDLKLISLSAHTKLEGLLSCRYRYTEIVSIEAGGKQHVYDISMKEGVEPAFVANGLVVHNTYNNMEQALSVFIEQLRAFRDHMTAKIFYQKVFPTIARVHGFVKRTKAELDHRVRISKDYKNLSPHEALKIPLNELLMPEISWKKQLRPEADMNFLDVLQRMEEKGIPVSLRTWAAAGGVDLDKQLETQEEDIETRLRIKKLRSKLESGEGAEDNLIMSSRGEMIKGDIGSIPIWDKERCGALGLAEARGFIRALRAKGKAANVAEEAKEFFANDRKKIETASYVAFRAGYPANVTLSEDTQKELFRSVAGCPDSRTMWKEISLLNRAVSKKADPKEFKQVEAKTALRDRIPSRSPNLLSGV